MSAKSTKLTQWIQELMESETDGGIPYKAVIALVKEKKLTAKDLDAIHKELHDRHIPLIFDNSEEDEHDAPDFLDEDMMEDDDEEENKDWHKETASDFAAAGTGITDPVRLYLRECGATPLLTAEQEMNLAKTIEKGKLPDATEEDKAAAARAKQKMASANLRLVVSIAKKYPGRNMPFLDLIQEGNIGLMHAAEKYDYTKDNRFSTYASWWIKEAITRAIDQQSREIRVPVHVAENIKRVQKAAKELQQEFGREAEPGEIAKKLGDRTEEEVKNILSYIRNPVSLETPVGEDGEDSLGDFVEDRSETTPEDAMDVLVRKEEVQELLETLNDREKEVISLRFGLGKDRTYTLEEIGESLGITRERVRQIESKAMEKLRKKAL